MKLTLANIEALKQSSNNTLVKRVCSYVIEEREYYDEKKAIFTEVLDHGCQSGTVGFLIYYVDTLAFYNKYKEEIIDLLAEAMNESGIYDPSELFGDKWDKEDPLIRDVQNQNLLARFGFEETLRNIGLNFEELEDEI
jgi:hypothetical protein